MPTRWAEVATRWRKAGDAGDGYGFGVDGYGYGFVALIATHQKDKIKFNGYIENMMALTSDVWIY